MHVKNFKSKQNCSLNDVEFLLIYRIGVDNILTNKLKIEMKTIMGWNLFDLHDIKKFNFFL